MATGAAERRQPPHLATELGGRRKYRRLLARLAACASPQAWPVAGCGARGSALTDVVVLDVHNELGQRVEVETAATESANVGKERSGGDACHGRRQAGRQRQQGVAGGGGVAAGGQRCEQLRHRQGRCGDVPGLRQARQGRTGSETNGPSLEKHKREKKRDRVNLVFSLMTSNPLGSVCLCPKSL